MFDDKRKGLKKIDLDTQKKIKVTFRNKSLGKWAAEKLGLENFDGYIDEVWQTLMNYED